MKRLINYLFMIFIFTFIFNIYVNAECSYQERKDLLAAAKNVDISFEPLEKGNQVSSFKIYVNGITKNIFVKYYNLNDGVENFIFYNSTDDGLFTLEDNNIYSVYTYDFVIYSANEKCTGYELYTKKVNKPMYNVYSENNNCKLKENENFKYCKKFFDKDYKLTQEKFNIALTEYNLDNIQEETKTNESKVNNYIIYLIIGSSLFLIIIVVIIFIRKKNREL